jgi:hypothetical protein
LGNNTGKTTKQGSNSTITITIYIYNYIFIYILITIKKKNVGKKDNIYKNSAPTLAVARLTRCPGGFQGGHGAARAAGPGAQRLGQVERL